MAGQIPLSQGRVSAQPSPITNVNQRSFGGDIAQSVGRASGVALDIFIEEKRALEKSAADAKQANDFARVTAAEDALVDIADQVGMEVRTGKLPTDEAETVYAKRSGELIAQASEGLDPRSAEMLKRAGLKNGNKVRRDASAKNRDNVTADLTRTLGSLQRSYHLNPKAATVKANAALEILGPNSSLNATQLEKMRQGFFHSAQLDSAFASIQAVSTDNQKLGRLKFDKFDALDQGDRTALKNKVSSLKLANTRAAEVKRGNDIRAQALVEKRAQDAVTLGRQLAADGILSQDVQDQIIKDVSPVPTAAAAFAAIIKDQRENGAFASRSLEEQQALVREATDAVISSNSPEARETLSRRQRVLSKTESDATKSPIKAFADRTPGFVLVPIDMDSGIQNTGAAIAERIEQVKANVDPWYGKPAPFLMDAEAEQLSRTIAALPRESQVDAAFAIANQIGSENVLRLGEQLGKQAGRREIDQTMSYVMSFAGDERGRRAANLLLRGTQAREDGSSTPPEGRRSIAPSKWQGIIAAKLEGVYPTQVLTDATVEASVRIVHGLAAERGGQILRKDFDNAIALASGSEFAEGRGVTINRGSDEEKRSALPLPPGMDVSAFNERLGVVGEHQIGRQIILENDGEDVPESGRYVIAGGRRVDLDVFKFRIGTTELQSIAPGRYLMIDSGRPIVTPRGKPITLDLN